MANCTLELSSLLLPPSSDTATPPLLISSAIGLGIFASALSILVMCYLNRRRLGCLQDTGDELDIELEIIGEPTPALLPTHYEETEDDELDVELEITGEKTPPALPTYYDTPQPFMPVVGESLLRLEAGGDRAWRVGEERCGCVICLEDLGGRGEGTCLVIVLDCQHAYHAACILAWLPNDARCPVCRRNPRVLYQVLFWAPSRIEVQIVECRHVSRQNDASEDEFE